MIRDAHNIKDGTVLEADICIVGSGPAGATVAISLIGHRLTVICLESGGLESESVAQDLNDGAFIGAPYAGLRQTRHRQAGGTVHIWNTPLNGEMGAKYVPLDSSDCRKRPEALYAWPFERSHLDNFYERAQAICGLGRFSYDAAPWRIERKTFNLPDSRVESAIYQLGPASVFTDSHFSAISSSDNVDFLYHATTCAITKDKGERTIRALDVATLNGNRFRVKSRLFVLAAGAVENARILLASREPGCEAPGNNHDWLGRCYMEHPRDYSMSLIPGDAEIFADASFYDRHRAEDGTLIVGRIALDPETIVRDGLPNASLTLAPLPRSTPPKSPFLGRLISRIKGITGRHIPAGYGWSRISDPARYYRGFRLVLNAEQFPHPDNRVVLGRDTDALGIPKPEVHWRWRPEDQVKLDRVRMIFASVLRAAGIGQIGINDDCVPDPNAHHHAGTTRMHEDPRCGVVDADGRVHDTDNLYVTGSSVFPTAGFANPTLTIVALALRLADHLKQRL